MKAMSLKFVITLIFLLGAACPALSQQDSVELIVNKQVRYASKYFESGGNYYISFLRNDNLLEYNDIVVYNGDPDTVPKCGMSPGDDTEVGGNFFWIDENTVYLQDENNLYSSPTSSCLFTIHTSSPGIHFLAIKTIGGDQYALTSAGNDGFQILPDLDLDNAEEPLTTECKFDDVYTSKATILNDEVYILTDDRMCMVDFINNETKDFIFGDMTFKTDSEYNCIVHYEKGEKIYMALRNGNDDLLLVSYEIDDEEGIIGSSMKLIATMDGTLHCRGIGIAEHDEGDQLFLNLHDLSMVEGNRIKRFSLNRDVELGEILPTAQEAEMGIAFFGAPDVDNEFGSVFFTADNMLYNEPLPSPCPQGCNGERGTCTLGSCVCEDPYHGEACELTLCEDPTCNDNGTCDQSTGICVCNPDYTGNTCSDRRCPHDCNGQGKCNETDFVCECDSAWAGDDCSIRSHTVCETFASEDSCISKLGCGWCRTDSTCKIGDGNGPVEGACKNWQYRQKFQVGLLIVAIIMIVVFVLMILNNLISAIAVDYRTAGVIGENENLLTTSFLKEAYWRDERSSKSWALFEQYQFIAYYALLNVTFPSRLIQFTSYFNWANLNLPLPFYTNENIYEYRNPALQLLNADQYANSLGLDRQQIYYSAMFWFMILIVASLVIYGIYALIAYILLKGRQPNIGNVLFQKLFYVVTRLFLLAQLPITMVSAYHIVGGHSNNKGTIAAAVITLLIFGILPILFNAFVVRKQDKNLLYLYLKLRYGAFYSVYHYKKARFGIVVLVRRFLIGCFIGFLVATVEKQDKFLAPQLFVVVAIHVIYVVVMFIMRPYLDTLHLILDLILALLNSVALGIVLMHKENPSDTGEIVAAVCVIICFVACLIAYIHSWTKIKGYATYICCLFKADPETEGKNEEELKDQKVDDEDDESSTIDSSIVSGSSDEESDEESQQESEHEESEQESSQESEQEESEQESSQESEQEESDQESDDDSGIDSSLESSDDE